MKILTRNQQYVLQAVQHSTVPRTVVEIAQSTRIATSSVRAALIVLERHGCVMRTGRTWRLPATPPDTLT